MKSIKDVSKDTFTPVIIDKLKEYNVEVVFHKLCPDDPDMVTSAIKEALDMQWIW